MVILCPNIATEEKSRQNLESPKDLLYALSQKPHIKQKEE